MVLALPFVSCHSYVSHYQQQGNNEARQQFKKSDLMFCLCVVSLTSQMLPKQSILCPTRLSMPKPPLTVLLCTVTHCSAREMYLIFLLFLQIDPV